MNRRLFMGIIGALPLLKFLPSEPETIVYDLVSWTAKSTTEQLDEYVWVVVRHWEIAFDYKGVNIAKIMLPNEDAHWHSFASAVYHGQTFTYEGKRYEPAIGMFPF